MPMTIADVRTAFPQYRNLSDAELATALHQKYYPTMPRDQFDAKIGFKASPIYGAGAVLNRSIPFFDEGADAMTAGLDLARGKAPNWKTAWRQQRAMSQAQADDFKAAHPIASSALNALGLGGQVAAAAASGGTSVEAEGLLGAGRAALAAPELKPGLLNGLKMSARGVVGLGTPELTGGGAANVARRVGGRMIQGAGVGGINAFADEDGSLADRNAAAMRGGVSGALTGLALPAAADTAVSAANAGRRMFMSAEDKAAARTGAILATQAPEIFGARGATTPEGQFPFQQWGPGGESVARSVAAVPGPGQKIAIDALKARRGQAAANILAAVKDTTGAAPEDFHPIKQTTEAQRYSEAQPLYQEADQTPIDPIDFQNHLGPIFDTDIGRKALGHAQSIAQIDALRGGEPYWDSSIIDNGQVVGTKTPGAKMLRSISQGWDTALEDSFNTPGARKTPGAKALYGLRDEFVKRLNDLVPAEGEARAAWAGGSNVLDALQGGRELPTSRLDPELIAANTYGLTPEEQDAQLTGMTRGIGDRLRGSQPSRFVKQYGNDDIMRERLRAAFPEGPEGDALFQKMNDAIEAEGQQQQVYDRIATGSRTTPLAQDIAASNAAGDDSGFATQAAIAGLKKLKGQSFTHQALNLALKNASRARAPALNNPAVSENLGNVLFGGKDPYDFIAQGGTAAADPATVARALQALGVSGAAMAGQSVTDQQP